MLKKLDDFHKTKIGHLSFGIVELAVAYGFVSLAYDRGNLFYYFLALVFLVGALQNAVKLIGEVCRGFKASKTRRA